MQLDIGEWQIRNWRPGDETALVRYANNRKIWLNLRDAFPHPYTADDARAWIKFAMEQNPAVNFAIASYEEAIGGVGLKLQEDVFRRSAEIGYWLGEMPSPILTWFGYLARSSNGIQPRPGCWKKRATPVKAAFAKV
jgi:RimJ/RimL family protein N-acetyltransferase